MSRLRTEFHRLYLPAGAAPAGDEAPAAAQLADAEGRVRALVLQVARPGDWQALSAVWRGVQAELGLPAPAVAINGQDGLQLWFSLAVPVPPAEGRAWLDGLCRRHLPELPAARVALLPQGGSADEPAAWGQAADVLAQQPLAEGWPAFVAPDLAAVFADTPWLDLPPSAEGQADLLAALQPIKADAWQAAMAQLAPPAEAAAPLPRTSAAPATPATTADGPARRFLLGVMNDEGAPLALRIEAAKALLPYDGMPTS